MKDVPAGEDAGDAGLQVLIDAGAARAGVELDARGLRDLVLGDEAHGEQQGVAGDDPLGTRDRGEVRADSRDLDRLHAVASHDARHGGG